MFLFQEISGGTCVDPSVTQVVKSELAIIQMGFKTNLSAKLDLMNLNQQTELVNLIF